MKKAKALPFSFCSLFSQHSLDSLSAPLFVPPCSLFSWARFAAEIGRSELRSASLSVILKKSLWLMNGELILLLQISSCTSLIRSIRPNAKDDSRYLSWDDYFMAIAFLSAQRSKDPNRQVGACLVSQERVILAGFQYKLPHYHCSNGSVKWDHFRIGYNGFPRGCSDDALPWAKLSVDDDPLQTKYPYVCHAEVNAILNKNHASARGQRLYVTMFPCNECAKVIIQAGVAEVVYFSSKKSSSDYSYTASRKLMSMAGVKVWQHKPGQEKITLELK